MNRVESRSQGSERPLFSFGVITDVQYADIPDGHSFKGVPRYYRHSLEALRQAVSAWKRQGDISFILQLGDLVDGKCPRSKSLSTVKCVADTFTPSRACPVYHMLGNHCFYNLPRHQLHSVLRLPTFSKTGSSYYTFTPYTGFRFVILDSYDISVLGWPEDHPKAQTARRLLEENNPNADKNSSFGLPKDRKRFVMFNGGVGEGQLVWLKQTLQKASESGEVVFIGSHVPLYQAATSSNTLLWNAEEVMQVVHTYRCVVACFSGHNHGGGYAVDSHGIHHRVLEAVLECPPGQNAFGRVDVFRDRISLLGSGRMPSNSMKFNIGLNRI